MEYYSKFRFSKKLYLSTMIKAELSNIIYFDRQYQVYFGDGLRYKFPLKKDAEEFLRKATKFLQGKLLFANDLYIEICFLQRDYYLLINERSKRIELLEKIKMLLDQLEKIFIFRGVNKDVFIYNTLKKIVDLIDDIFDLYAIEAQNKSDTVNIHRIKNLKRRLEILKNEINVFNTENQGTELLQELKLLVA